MTMLFNGTTFTVLHYIIGTNMFFLGGRGLVFMLLSRPLIVREHVKNKLAFLKDAFDKVGGRVGRPLVHHEEIEICFFLIN